MHVPVTATDDIPIPQIDFDSFEEADFIRTIDVLGVDFPQITINPGIETVADLKTFIANLAFRPGNDYLQNLGPADPKQDEGYAWWLSLELYDLKWPHPPLKNTDNIMDLRTRDANRMYNFEDLRLRQQHYVAEVDCHAVLTMATESHGPKTMNELLITHDRFTQDMTVDDLKNWIRDTSEKVRPHWPMRDRTWTKYNLIDVDKCTHDTTVITPYQRQRCDPLPSDSKVFDILAGRVTALGMAPLRRLRMEWSDKQYSMVTISDFTNFNNVKQSRVTVGTLTDFNIDTIGDLQTVLGIPESAALILQTEPKARDTSLDALRHDDVLILKPVETSPTLQADNLNLKRIREPDEANVIEDQIPLKWFKSREAAILIIGVWLVIMIAWIWLSISYCKNKNAKDDEGDNGGEEGGHDLPE